MERDRLGDIENAVARSFEFLRREYGFVGPDVEVAESPPKEAGSIMLQAHVPLDGRPASVLRLRGPQATIEVWHDPRGEVGVYVVDHRSGERFALQDILLFQGVRVDRFGSMCSGGYEGFSRTLARLASGLAQFGGPWLLGHPEKVDDLRRYSRIVRGLYTARYTEEARPGTLGSRLHQAFQRREFAKLVRLLERIDGPSSDTETEALSYAREQLSLKREDEATSGAHGA